MHALVTGGAGFIGSNLSRKMLETGHKVTIVDNFSTGKRENIPTDCEFIDLDMTKVGFSK